MYLIVPVTVKLMSFDVNLRNFSVTDLAPFVVLATIQPSMDFQSLLGCGGTDQVHNDLQSLQRYPLPVTGNVAEQPMLNLVHVLVPGG
jgi:hypothetical protein